MYNWVEILVHILMYILFINSSDKCDIFFSTQFNNNSNKKKMSNPWVNPDPIQPMWVGLDLCDGLGWVEFFLTHHGGLGQKISLTRSNPTHAHP